jgi:hypothetical protein
VIFCNWFLVCLFLCFNWTIVTHGLRTSIFKQNCCWLPLHLIDFSVVSDLINLWNCEYQLQGTPILKQFLSGDLLSWPNPWGPGLEYVLHILVCVVRGDWMGAVLGMKPENWGPVSQQVVWHDIDPSLLKGPKSRA